MYARPDSKGKAPKKAGKFELHDITKRNLKLPVYTATGLPAGAYTRSLLSST